MLKEFKEFAVKGRVGYMTTGTAFGTPFGTIITLQVTEVVIPLAGPFSGGVNLKTSA